jgi:lipoyl-dependent peroxiredoxin
MASRIAEAEWSGNLQQGQGKVRLGSGVFEGPYNFRSRMENGRGTNPEELLGAAHAGCFSMALAAQLTAAGYVPKRIFTRARVHLEKSGERYVISKIELELEASVPGLDEGAFHEHAEIAKTTCPVSKALAGVPIELSATLE